jgi:RNA polymerase sigma-70 factor (ECF subfamily)
LVQEAELLKLLQAGDAAAFATLVQTYQARMLRLARTFVTTSASAEEVVQDAWVGVIRGIDRFEGRSSIATWLFSILVNRAKSVGVRERRLRTDRWSENEREQVERFDAIESWAVPPERWAEEAEDRLVARHLAAQALACLEDLPAPQRQVVLLRDVEGLSATQACSLLGITDANQRVLLHRGRVRVRSALEKQTRP